MNELIYRARLYPWASLPILFLLCFFYIPQIPVTSYLLEITKRARKISSNVVGSPSIEPIQADLIYFNRQVVACRAEEILSAWHPNQSADVPGKTHSPLFSFIFRCFHGYIRNFFCQFLSKSDGFQDPPFPQP